MKRRLVVFLALAATPTRSIAAVGDRGSYTDRVAIEVPPYHGLEPMLDLDYDSQSPAGIAGAGWRLTGVSTIHRTGDTGGPPTFTSDDQFAIDGVELLECAKAGSVASCSAGGTH